jgi:hypothetical protein
MIFGKQCQTGNPSNHTKTVPLILPKKKNRIATIPAISCEVLNLERKPVVQNYRNACFSLVIHFNQLVDNYSQKLFMKLHFDLIDFSV